MKERERIDIEILREARAETLMLEGGESVHS